MKSIKVVSKNIIIFLVLSSVICLFGCQALGKKFTRKPKNKDKEIEDVVFAPIEYPETVDSKEQIYEKQYLFWRNWHSELINNIYGGASRKKQIDCINESLESLGKMEELLNEEKQKELVVYIEELNKIKEKLLNSRFISLSSIKRKLVSLERKIQGKFSYRKAKGYIR